MRTEPESSASHQWFRGLLERESRIKAKPYINQNLLGLARSIWPGLHFFTIQVVPSVSCKARGHNISRFQLHICLDVDLKAWIYYRPRLRGRIVFLQNFHVSGKLKVIRHARRRSTDSAIPGCRELPSEDSSTSGMQFPLLLQHPIRCTTHTSGKDLGTDVTVWTAGKHSTDLETKEGLKNTLFAVARCFHICERQITKTSSRS